MHKYDRFGFPTNEKCPHSSQPSNAFEKKIMKHELLTRTHSLKTRIDFDSKSVYKFFFFKIELMPVTKKIENDELTSCMGTSQTHRYA